MPYNPIFVASGTVDMEPLRFQDFSSWNREWSLRHRSTFDEWGRVDSKTYRNILGGVPHWMTVWEYESLQGALRTKVSDAWQDWITRSRPLGVTQARASVFRSAWMEPHVFENAPGTTLLVSTYDHSAVAGTNRSSGPWISSWLTERENLAALYGITEMRPYINALYTSPVVMIMYIFQSLDRLRDFLLSEDVVDMMSTQQSRSALNQELAVFLPSTATQ